MALLWFVSLSLVFWDTLKQYDIHNCTNKIVLPIPQNDSFVDALLYFCDLGRPWNFD